MPFGSRFSPLVSLAAALAIAGCSGIAGMQSGGEGVIERAYAEAPPAGSASGDPQVTLSASSSVVGTAQPFNLTWTSKGVSACEASGGWSGSRPTSGSASVGPISASTTFTLTCSGEHGNAMAMISVAVLGVVTLSWQAPTENVDGSPLNDLAGYRIHYGFRSRDYDTTVSMPDPAATQRSLELASGVYYIAMTAMDKQGNESAYSNEVIRAVD
jgi:hypothetical protein